MDLRYGKIDENVLKRSVEDVILHEKQRLPSDFSYKEKPDGRSGRDSFFAHTKRQGFQQSFYVRPAVPAVSLTCSPESAGLAGELAVIRSANSLAAAGIRAKDFSPVILLPPGTQEKTLRTMLSRICRISISLKIDVSGVYAEVTDAVIRPVVSGNMSGMPGTSVMPGTSDTSDMPGTSGMPGISGMPGTSGMSDTSGMPDTSGMNGKRVVESGDFSEDFTGMDIIQAGFAGLEGSVILTRECREDLKTYFPLSLLTRMDIPGGELCVLRAAETAVGAGAQTMVNLSCGGFFAGMWELSKRTGCGLEADLKCVPLLQETIEITNHLGINPYAMRSEGGLLIAAFDGKRMVRKLMDAGLFAARIGALTPGKDKIIRNGEEIRYLDRPGPDSLDLFFHKYPCRLDRPHRQADITEKPGKGTEIENRNR